MFSLKLVARPDARMVEVPLEIEAELPREFDGAALLAASGLPRKVKLKAARDALKLSTAYRADRLVGDIVKSSLRGTADDVDRVQQAVVRFVRTVRERRQEGATLVVSSNGRGKIDVLEQLPPGRSPPAPPAEAPRSAPPLAGDRLAALERRLAELEARLGRAGAAAAVVDRVGLLEQRLAALQGQARPEPQAAAQSFSRASGGPRRQTAIDAYAEGLRQELVAVAGAAFARSRSETERCDRAAALAAEAERLGAPADGTADRLREASAQAAARQSGLERLSQEIEFYGLADLPIAEQLLKRLDDGPQAPDPGPSLETVAQAVVRAAKGPDLEERAAWLRRAAALCGWQLLEPSPGEALSAEWHQAVDAGGEVVVALASPGLKRADGSGIVRARVLVDPGHPGGPATQAPPPKPPSHEPLPATVAPVPEPATPALAEIAPAAAALSPPPSPFGELPVEAEINPDEAAMAAEAASRIPKIVAGDPAHADEALAAEVALAQKAAPSEEVAEDEEPHPLPPGDGMEEEKK